jgi:hypothetical protein
MSESVHIFRDHLVGSARLPAERTFVVKAVKHETGGVFGHIVIDEDDPRRDLLVHPDSGGEIALTIHTDGETTSISFDRVRQ